MKAGDLVRMTKKRAGHPSFRPGIAKSYLGIYAEGTSDTWENGATMESHIIWIEGKETFFSAWHWKFEVISESR
jgi:hypothetical protein